MILSFLCCWFVYSERFLFISTIAKNTQGVDMCSRKRKLTNNIILRRKRKEFYLMSDMMALKIKVSQVFVGQLQIVKHWLHFEQNSTTSNILLILYIRCYVPQRNILARASKTNLFWNRMYRKIIENERKISPKCRLHFGRVTIPFKMAKS